MLRLEEGLGIDAGSPARVMGMTWCLGGSCTALLNLHRGTVTSGLIRTYLYGMAVAHTAPLVIAVISFLGVLH